MITFKTIRYKNILSVGNQFIEVQLNRSPSTVITGKNGNGKSTILDALNFALFGRPYRSVKLAQLVNSINAGHLLTELEFSVNKKEYKIVRGHLPRIFEIYENGNLIDQDANKRDYQIFLEDSILGGLNETIFKQVIVIGSANYRPFMQLPAAQRREVIEELLDVKIFSQMLSIVKDKLSNLKSSLSDLDYEVQILEEKIKLNKSKIESDSTEKQDKIDDLNKEIAKEEKNQKSLEVHLKEYQDKLKSIQAKLPAKDMLEDTISQLNTLKTDLTKTKKKNSDIIKFYSDNSVCPTCTQTIDEDLKGKMMKEASDTLDKVTDGITRVADQLKTKNEHLKKFKALQKQEETVKSDIITLENSIVLSKKIAIQHNKNIKTLNDTVIDTTEVDSLESELDQLKGKRKEQIESQDYHTVTAGMLKDGGIKSKIIKQYIPLMNKVINEYLIRLNLPVNFTLDENFDEVIKSRHRDVFQYSNFSEGEKARIDIAILLSWRYIAKTKNTINTNLLFFDETFDSSLDENATDELLVILKEMKNSNIFVISHKTDLTDKLFSHIEFVKQGNFTTMSAERT